MSDFDWNDDNLNDTEPQLVKNLRKEIAKRDAALKERDTQFAQLQDEVRRNSVSNILRDLGVKPKVANLIPKDIEANADAVKAWVKDYEDVFGSTKVSEQAAADSETGQETASSAPEGATNLDPEAQAAWNRMQTAETSAGQVPTGEDAQLSWLANAARKAEGSADAYFAFLRGETKP